MSTAWFCPSCQKYHAPHVETCPGGGTGTAPYDVLRTWPLTPNWVPSHLRPEPDPCAGCQGGCGNAACPKRPFITSTATGLVSSSDVILVGAVQ